MHARLSQPLDAKNNCMESKNKFNSLLVEYFNTFNYIELNVGLCIRFLSGLSYEEMNSKIEKLNFAKKIEILLKLTSAELDKKDLHEWCIEAHKKRHERNMYMHGQWHFIPHLEEGVEFSIAPWVQKKYAALYPGQRIALHKLECIVDDIKSCFDQFNRLRTKYGI